MPNSRYSGYQYETSPRKIKPEYEPQQKKKNSNKTGNNNKNKTSTAKKKTTSANTKRKKHVNSQVKVVSYVLLGFVILLAISYRNSLITESFNKKEQLKSDLAVIEKENQQLEVNIQNSLNLSNIEKAAKENSGMKKLDATQKHYVNLPKKDYVEPASEQIIIEEEKNWFEKIIEVLIEKISLRNYYIKVIVIFLCLYVLF